jgi:hypothetical protein
MVRGSSDLPTSPDSVYVHSFGHIHDQLYVCIVVVVGATRNFDVMISHPDVVGIGRQIFRRSHDGELDGLLVAKCLVGPFPYRADLLDGSNTVVGDQNLELAR